MKHLWCIILVLYCCNSIAATQKHQPKKKHTSAAKKSTHKSVNKKKIQARKSLTPPPLAMVTIETQTGSYDVMKAARPAAAYAAQTQDVQRNADYFNNKKVQERFAGAAEQHPLYFRGSPEGQPSTNISPSEILPTGRILNGPSQYDSRVEVRALDPTLNWVKKIINNSYSVAVVVDRSRLRQFSKDLYVIDDSNTLGSMYQLCPGEAFINQPVVGTGTAIVTGKRQMLTAGHVFTGPLSHYAIIFGYEINNKNGSYKTIFPADSVYFPIRVVGQSAELDIAVFNVDRDINATPLKWSSETNPPVNEPIYMIGFPYGLPKKVAANAEVITPNNDLTCFYTSLDAFQGNSGSPVFNLKTNEVIGILVSGNVDYHWNGSCNISVDCSAPYCQGEKAIRINSIKNLLYDGKK